MDSPLRERAGRAIKARVPIGYGMRLEEAFDYADAAISTLTLSDHIAAVEASGTHVVLPRELPYEVRERATIPTLRLKLGKGNADPWDTVDAVWRVILEQPRDAK